jgi:hypothetical protein
MAHGGPEGSASHQAARMVSEENVNAETLLTDVYRLAGAGEIDAALDLIYKTIDDMMFDGNLDDVDEILRRADVTSVDASIVLGFLAITLPVANRLKHRSAYFAKTKTHLARSHSPDDVASMFVGLER